MVREFQNKNYWALILGGSSGLGLATARKLAAHGCNICIVHRNLRMQMPEIEVEFKKIENEGVAFISFNVDAGNEEKRTAVISELKKNMGTGRIRALVHSIAKGNLKPMTAEEDDILTHEDIRLTLDSMAISLYDWTKALFDHRLFAEDARIISFTSEGNKRVWKNYAAVSAAKVALESITRNIALEFASYGMRANCIQAGVTDTVSMRMIPGSDVIKEQSLVRNPFKRLTRPADVADVVYLLCKDEAAWINGSIIPVDGGEHIC